jgi:hypothetical protein
MYSSAQRLNASRGSCNVRPNAVSSYSTLGGISAYTCRSTSPSRSRSRNVSEDLPADPVDRGAQVSEKRNGTAMAQDGIDLLRIEGDKIAEVWLFSSDPQSEDAFWGTD